MTSSLLARKGEAMPAALGSDGKGTHVWNTTEVSPQYRPVAHQAAANNPVHVRLQEVEEAMSISPEQDPDLASGPSFADHVVHAGEKKHRLSLPLTQQEHERLGIVAVKRGMTRHQLMRHALDDYFARLAREYANACACLSAGGCRNNCDHS
jgi:hypothetical protein